jgi:hypothetical protein
MFLFPLFLLLLRSTLGLVAMTSPMNVFYGYHNLHKPAAAASEGFHPGVGAAAALHLPPDIGIESLSPVLS